MQSRAEEIFQRKRPLVIAHRGYSAIAPENSQAAFEFAAEVAPDLVELDYYHCRENVPVVFHDRTLDRTTNAVELWNEAGLTIGAQTVSELKDLDTGGWFHPRFAGSQILTLREALGTIQEQGTALIERKSGEAETLVSLLRETGQLHRVIVQSFDWSFIADCHRLEPSLLLGALGPPASRDGQRLTKTGRILDSGLLEEIAQTGARFAGWSQYIDEAGIQEAHRRGLKVFVYVVNTTVTARELMAIGVDGLISDNPGLIWKAIAEHYCEE